MRSTKRRLLHLLQIAALLLLTLAPAGPTQARDGDGRGRINGRDTVAELPQVVIPPGAEVVLDLKLSNNPGNVRGVDLTLAYTPAIVEFLSVSKGPLAADWMLVSNVRPNGLIDIALAGVTPPAGDVVLARLTFRGVGQKGQTSAVAFQRAQINEVDVSGSTQAGQITLDTPPVTDLRAAVIHCRHPSDVGPCRERRSSLRSLAGDQPALFCAAAGRPDRPERGAEHRSQLR